jgi:hypothetical protein
MGIVAGFRTMFKEVKKGLREFEKDESRGEDNR